MTIEVSDHALIRYIERVKGIDLDSVRDHIAGLVESAVTMGATSIRIDGAVYCLEPHARVVTTVLTERQLSKSRRLPRRPREFDIRDFQMEAGE